VPEVLQALALMTPGSLDGQRYINDFTSPEEGLTVDVRRVFWVTAG
jgi:hypothetical protein